jgi:hypothetical protein
MRLDENDFRRLFSVAAGKLSPSAVAARVQGSRKHRPVQDIKPKQVSSSLEMLGEGTAACALKRIILRLLDEAPPGFILISEKSRAEGSQGEGVSVTLFLGEPGGSKAGQGEGRAFVLEYREISKSRPQSLTKVQQEGKSEGSTGAIGIDDLLRELYREGLIDTLIGIKNSSVTTAGRAFLGQ